jgi:hypothetical protein
MNPSSKNMPDKNLALAEAVSDLAALLDYAGKRREASSVREEIPALSSGRSRRLEALTRLNRIRGGILALKQSALSNEARDAVEDVVARIQSVLSQHN